MSRMTKEINKITGTIIGISGKLIVYAVVILLLFEGITRGYAFGHDIFYATAMEEAPGTPKTVTIPKGYTSSEAAEVLRDAGLIDNVLAFQIQKLFYDYDIHPGTYELNTSMTSKEILQELNTEPETAETGESQASAAGGNAVTDDEAQDALLDMYGAREAGADVGEGDSQAADQIPEEASGERSDDVDIQIEP